MASASHSYPLPSRPFPIRMRRHRGSPTHPRLDLGPCRLDGRHQHQQTRAARARLAPIPSPPTSPATCTHGKWTVSVLIAGITRYGRAGPLTRWRSRPTRSRDGCTHQSVHFQLALAAFFIGHDHARRLSQLATRRIGLCLLVRLTVGNLAQHLVSEQSEAGVDDVREQLREQLSLSSGFAGGPRPPMQWV